MGWFKHHIEDFFESVKVGQVIGLLAEPESEAAFLKR